jgi:Na+-transporting NADH:ubiquinone oxidoreductase subunit NqrE
MIAELAALALFSSLSLNLIAQFGLGIQPLSEDEGETLPLFQSGVLFITVLALWVVFSIIITPYMSELFIYFLLFPFAMLGCWALECAAERFIPRVVPKKRLFSAVSAYNGLAFAALALTLHMAGSFVEAFALSAGFALGILFAVLILNEIRKRSAIENVPVFLRGKPLRLISMGFLAIIFSSTAAILLKALA